MEQAQFINNDLIVNITLTKVMETEQQEQLQDTRDPTMSAGHLKQFEDWLCWCGPGGSARRGTGSSAGVARGTCLPKRTD